MSRLTAPDVAMNSVPTTVWIRHGRDVALAGRIPTGSVNMVVPAPAERVAAPHARTLGPTRFATTRSYPVESKSAQLAAHVGPPAPPGRIHPVPSAVRWPLVHTSPEGLST